ncbi:type II toxin-antitoxin system RelE/ParE family toxin [Oceaniradius stylonematis]|jgi:toxin ParE1/3/4|uniref:type II toxin-antitoxin system RelE/ParE family toxin n=1 Tax=Oceaniradius stylonematis TaxID=2184161 RepID=UPI0035D037E2
MAGYLFTPGAREDLADIWLHTEEAWGEDQADRYVEALFDCCARISAGTARGRLVPGAEGIHCHRCQHHVIFFLRGDDEAIIIIALFHERMDLMRRLAGRL